MSHARTEHAVRTDAKRDAARAFDRAVRAANLTNAQVGMLLDLDEKRVRRLRSDDDADLDVVPNVADLILCSPALGDRFVQELRSERVRRYGATPSACTVEQAAARAVACMGRFVAAVGEALDDGVISGPERPAIERALMDGATAVDGLTEMLRGGAR